MPLVRCLTPPRSVRRTRVALSAWDLRTRTPFPPQRGLPESCAIRGRTSQRGNSSIRCPRWWLGNRSDAPPCDRHRGGILTRAPSRPLSQVKAAIREAEARRRQEEEEEEEYEDDYEEGTAGDEAAADAEAAPLASTSVRSSTRGGGEEEEGAAGPYGATPCRTGSGGAAGRTSAVGKSPLGTPSWWRVRGPAGAAACRGAKGSPAQFPQPRTRSGTHLDAFIARLFHRPAHRRVHCASVGAPAEVAGRRAAVTTMSRMRSPQRRALPPAGSRGLRQRYSSLAWKGKGGVRCLDAGFVAFSVVQSFSIWRRLTNPPPGLRRAQTIDESAMRPVTPREGSDDDSEPATQAEQRQQELAGGGGGRAGLWAPGVPPTRHSFNKVPLATVVERSVDGHLLSVIGSSAPGAAVESVLAGSAQPLKKEAATDCERPDASSGPPSPDTPEERTEGPRMSLSADDDESSVRDVPAAAEAAPSKATLPPLGGSSRGLSQSGGGLHLLPPLTPADKCAAAVGDDMVTPLPADPKEARAVEDEGGLLRLPGGGSGSMRKSAAGTPVARRSKLPLGNLNT